MSSVLIYILYLHLIVHVSALIVIISSHMHLQIHSMPDSMCFVEDIDAIFPYSARTVLESTQQVTKRACEVACADNELVSFTFLQIKSNGYFKCKGVSYTDPTCTFIGDRVENVFCQGFTAATKVVSTKSEVCKGFRITFLCSNSQ